MHHLLSGIRMRAEANHLQQRMLSWVFTLAGPELRLAPRYLVLLRAGLLWVPLPGYPDRFRSDWCRFSRSLRGSWPPRRHLQAGSWWWNLPASTLPPPTPVTESARRAPETNQQPP